MVVTMTAEIQHTVLAGLVPAIHDCGCQARKVAMCFRKVAVGRDESAQDSGRGVAATGDVALCHFDAAGDKAGRGRWESDRQSAPHCAHGNPAGSGTGTGPPRAPHAVTLQRRLYRNVNGTRNTSCSGVAPAGGGGNGDARRRLSRAIRSSDGVPLLVDILAQDRAPSAATAKLTTATPGSETPAGLARAMRSQIIRA